ncbi:hypothetical protein VHUM_00846 [Vanrija humicola]|uniref:Phosphatidate phosphatase APP1 catalytic domain-containing protein n=1 Tax=Vanrija humicola TaxID=5417 RepID=A0A7D8V3W2_VANHU|nr:hypothetical protein VHUM_00846 [Vanrija humicola]
MPPGRPPIRAPRHTPAVPPPQPSGSHWAGPPSPPRRVTRSAGAPPPSSDTSGGASSSRRPGLLQSGSGLSSYLGSTAGFASKAKSAFFSAGSYVATTASTVAAAASAQTSGERRAAWEDWARDWRDGKRSSIIGKETIHVLPGWAAKKPRGDDPKAFDLSVSTVGYCTFVRDPKSASRTQRALMGIAKRFAALPAAPLDIPADPVIDSKLSSSPDKESPLIDLGDDAPAAAPGAARPAPVRRSSTSPSFQPYTPPPRTLTQTDIAFQDPSLLSLAHEYMDSRLRPFWSSVLAFRRIALAIYTVPLESGKPPPTADADLFAQEPLLRTTFTTNAQGHFAQNFTIPWERIASHTQSVPMAYDSSTHHLEDWGLVIRAELLSDDVAAKLPSAPATQPADVIPGGTLPYTARTTRGASPAASAPTRADSSDAGVLGLGTSAVEATAVLRISGSGGIRIISDIDDTVKHSDILSGAREVFRNVFCRKLEDICVPGINTLYEELISVGASGIHFVSNSPFELFPVITEFFQLHTFPTYYSLKLKYYGGRSIVTSLFEPAGQRKRPGIVEIMDEFKDSKFIMIGDSGEQDLEVYTSLAQERPDQVTAIFIRDVTSGRVGEFVKNGGVYDSTPRMSQLDLNDAASDVERTLASERSAPPSGTTTPTTQGSQVTAEAINSTVEELQTLSYAQQKILRQAADWETRLARAEADLPASIPLVIFKDVEEIESMARELVYAESIKAART